MKRSSESVGDSVLNWLKKLSKHFGVELTEDQVEIFAHALRDATAYQVNEAFERCLNECEFMPRLAQVHARMPEQRYATENPGRFILFGRPILDMNRPIAEEICFGLTGREYSEIRELCGEPTERGQEATELVKKVFGEANKLRIERGIFK
jgi:hypothetical protein